MCVFLAHAHAKVAHVCAPQRGHVIKFQRSRFKTCTGTSTLIANGSGHELRSVVIATIPLLESNVRPLCLTISIASRLPYTLFSSFPFAMRSRYHPSLPVHGLLSGLGGYRVALTITFTVFLMSGTNINSVYCVFALGDKRAPSDTA